MSRETPLKHLFYRFHRGVILIVLLGTSSVLILFNGTPGVARPQEIGFSIISFFQGLISGTVTWTEKSVNSVFGLFDLKEKYSEAVARLQILEGNERSLILLRDENRRLKEQLDFQKTFSYSIISAEIIAKDPERVYSFLTINKGFLQGINKNMPVVVTQNGVTGLLGKVFRVGLSSAVIQPILDANLYISARLQNSRFEGLVSGKGNNEDRLIMTFVKKRARDQIQIGDIVVTSGRDSIYPPDLLIGRVHSISSKDYENTLEIELESFADFSRLEYLTILRQDL